MAKLPADKFIRESQHLPVIDVRSPAEYEEGHIPGAYNIPLFDNEERRLVGTAYKQQSREEALLLGLDLTGPKMRSFVEQAKVLAPEGEVLVHCWRGGMRSESFAWLLNTAGLKTNTLEGGYKAYRRHVLDTFRQADNLIVLTGETGSGKTEILHALAELQEQVIDLEAIAHHRGSAFGGIGMQNQPTTEQFHNNIHQQWQTLNPCQRIWIEDESFSIGRVKLPHELWERMDQAPVIKISVPKAIRVHRLVEEYGRLDQSALKAAILKIQRRLGGLETQKAIEALENGQLETVADMLLHYYDKGYHRCLVKKNNKFVREVVCDTDDAYVNALKIREAVDNMLLTSFQL